LQDVSNAKGIGDGPPTEFQHALYVLMIYSFNYYCDDEIF